MAVTPVRRRHRPRKGWARLAVGVVGVIAVLGAAAASAAPVDLELVIAVDVSRSVDEEEARLQRDGYVTAFSDPRVVDAIRSGPHGAIAVAYVEWSGADQQKTLIDWTRIDEPTSAAAFASRLAEAPRSSVGWTSVSGAIDYAARLFVGNGYEGARLVIDISGDGANNSGRLARLARDAAVAKGITINGLPILNDRPSFGRPAETGLNVDYETEVIRYYETEVIGGLGAFLIAVEDFRAFGQAILAKLLREIAERPSPGTSAVAPLD